MRKVEFPIRVKKNIHGIENTPCVAELYSPDLDKYFELPESSNKADVKKSLKNQIRDYLIQCAKDKTPIESPRPVKEHIKEDDEFYSWIIVSIKEEVNEKNNLSIFRYLFPVAGVAANTIAGVTQSTIEFFSLQAFFENPTLAFVLGLSGAIINLFAFSADYFATSSLEDLSKIGKNVDQRLAKKLQNLDLIKKEKDEEAHRIQLGNNRHQLFSCLSLRRKRNIGMLVLSLAFMIFVTVNALFEGGTAYQEVYQLGNLSRSRGAKSLNKTGLIVIACFTAVVMFLRTIAFEWPLELQIVEKIEREINSTNATKSKIKKMSERLSVNDGDEVGADGSSSSSETDPLVGKKRKNSPCIIL